MNLGSAPGDCPLPQFERHRERSPLHLTIDAPPAQSSEPLDFFTAEDSGFHSQPLSQLRIRMIPLNRQEGQEVFALIAQSAGVKTLMADILKDHGFVADTVTHIGRFAFGPGPSTNSSRIPCGSEL